MHVTVEDGRATAVKGDPDHPITHGFLCGKVSNYLDRVYSDERLLHPLVREDGGFRRASWDEALDVAAAGLQRAIDAHGGESILPYSYAGTQGLVQGNLMSQRVMNALGASELVRTICATAGIAGVGRDARPLARGRPRGVAARALPAALGLEPDEHRAAPVADPARDAAQRRAARGRRPASAARRRGWRTSTCGRCPGTDAALALGMMRAIRDAGLVDEDWCRAHATGLDELLEELDEWPLDRAAEVTGVPAADIERVGLDFAQHAAGAAAAGRRRPAPPGRAGRVQHGRLAARARRRLAAPRRRLLVHPDGHRSRDLVGARRTARPAGEAGAADQHVAARRRAVRRPRPAGRRARRVELEPGPGRARPDEGAGRARAARPLHGRARAVHDRHGGARRRRAAGHDPARAPGRDLLLGPPLRDAQQAGDRAARRGQAEHGDLPAARRPARPRRPVLPRLRRGARASRCSPRRPTTSRSTASTSAAGRRSTSGRARSRTPRAASARRTGSSTCTPSTSRPARWRTRSSPRASRSR